MSSAPWPSKIVALTLTVEPARLGGLDRRHGAVEHALLGDRLVVMRLEPVEMDREEQIGRRLEQIELLFQQQRIGAQRDEFLARHDAVHDRADILVDERFAARNGDHRGAAFVHRREAFVDRQPPVEDRIGIVDLAAADAGKIAAEQRFQHQHQRVALAAEQFLLEQIGPNLQLL